MVLSRVSITSHGAVASEHILASNAGCDVLRKGGNAADAAAAVSFTIGVVQHQLGGLGGDCFVLFHEAKTGKVHCLNSSGWAPKSLSIDFLKNRGENRVPLFGATSVVVPGIVKGVSVLHKRFGNLEFADLLSPALDCAEHGFPISAGFARSLRATFLDLPAASHSIFARNRAPLKEGDVLKQPNLGKVLNEIRERGPDAFYEGWIADSICSELSKLGVPTDPSDLSDFRPEWVEPLRMEYRGASVYEIPPNSMGATTLLILKYLQSFDGGRPEPDSAERVELTLRAVIPSYQKRDRMLGDPRFLKIDLDRFLAPAVGENIPGAPVQFTLDRADTTFFAVADQEGNVVSAIQSLFHHFGSRVFVEPCGLFLNNRGAAFAMQGPNKLEPRKRPLHTLSALLVERESSVIGLGSSGGDLRPQQHALFLTNLLDYSMSLEETIDFPRFLWRGGKSLLIEQGYRGLRGISFQPEEVAHPGKTGVAQGVEVAGNVRKGVCDVRGDGEPAGI
ncbi:MAG: gamma-glutamyltransferase family protein [Thaumarchaeota archaeon]|nr:gamma-glutamyltransferase family protein [Nitrososphaerota archaeon]